MSAQARADPLEREAGTNRSAERDGLERPRDGDELDDPAKQELVGVDEIERLLELGNVVEVDDGLKPRDRMLLPLATDDLDLLVDRRVAERDLEREAVELRLGERERSLLLDRVLRREQQERVGQRVRDAVDRRLTLAHRLEERGLRLRHRAVDLVDEQDVREHRSRPELELARLLVEDREPGDVGRLDVGRALDAPDGRAADRAGNRPGQHRLRRAGDVLEEDVPSGRERGEHELDLLGLALDDGLDVREQPRERRDGALELLVVRRGYERLFHGPSSSYGRCRAR